MEPKKLTLATPYSIALLLFVPTAASPFALAQRSAGVHIDWTIVLSGPSYGGMTPIGNSDYEVQNTFHRFEADCDQVNVVDGTLLDVKVNGKYVGSFPSLDQGGALDLTGRRAPNVTRGTKISISIHNGPTILSGHY
jgi:hypothetical protein